MVSFGKHFALLNNPRKSLATPGVVICLLGLLSGELRFDSYLVNKSIFPTFFFQLLGVLLIPETRAQCYQHLRT